MNLMQFLLILKARWKIVAIFAGVCFALSLLWALASSDHYRATAQVLVQVRAPDTVGDTTNGGLTPQLAPDYLATQVDVIKSDRVALTAVKELGLADDPDLLRRYRDAGSPESPASFAANLIQRNLTVVPSPDSRVISLAYSSPSAESAKMIANAFAEAYRDVSLDLQADPARQASGWFETSASTIRTQLANAEKTLSERRAALGVTGLPEQADADDARLAALSQQLATVQAQQSVAVAKTRGGALPDALMSPVVQGLEADISRLEAQRRQLATVAGPNNVDYQQLTAQLSRLNSELVRQKAQVAQAAATSASQSTASVGSLTAAMEAQRKRTIESQRARGEIAALEQDVANLKQTYDQVVQRKVQSDLLGAANQTNVSLLSPATTPSGPAGLPRIYKAVVGLFVGTILGLLAALIVEFLDQRMRVPDDAAVWLGIPSLGGVRTLAPPPQGRIGGVVRRYLPAPSGKDTL